MPPGPHEWLPTEVGETHRTEVRELAHVGHNKDERRTCGPPPGQDSQPARDYGCWSPGEELENRRASCTRELIPSFQ